MFHNHIEGRDFVGQVQDAKFVSSYSISNPSFPYPLGGGFSSQAQATYSMVYKTRTPTLVHWNVAIQRQLSPMITVDVGYVGSHGYHLQRITAANIRILQILPDGSKFFAANAPLINPNFSDINYSTTDAVSAYNAFQTNVRKNLSRYLQFQGSYTFSKALSDADSLNGSLNGAVNPDTMDMWDYKRDYSLSGYDQRHSFVFLGQHKMPWDNALNGRIPKAVLGGWAANGILRGGSGLTFGLGAGFNNSRNADRSVPDRPDLAPGASNNPILE